MFPDKVMRFVITLYSNDDLFKQQALILIDQNLLIDGDAGTYNERKAIFSIIKSIK